LHPKLGALDGHVRAKVRRRRRRRRRTRSVLRSRRRLVPLIFDTSIVAANPPFAAAGAFFWAFRHRWGSFFYEIRPASRF
jgi:hypothetical protein